MTVTLYEELDMFIIVPRCVLLRIRNISGKSYVYWTVHHLYSCVKRKNQLDATYFII